MALPTSGVIAISDINVEFDRAETAQTSMSQLYRGGGIVTGNNTNVSASGAISLSQFYGAKREFAFTISTSDSDQNLRNLAILAGWDQSAPVVATVASGIVLSGEFTGLTTRNPGLTINGSFPFGVTLVNNGVIVGSGGQGGTGGPNTSTPATAGGAGGAAIVASVAVSIENNGTIAGGGGGGGGGGYSSVQGAFTIFPFPGSGGGGGRHSAVGASPPGGGAGAFGTEGTYSAAGIGGGQSGSGGGGNGGNWGAAGNAGANGTGPQTTVGGAGGAAGAVVIGSSNVTWLVEGTRLGPLA